MMLGMRSLGLQIQQSIWMICLCPAMALVPVVSALALIGAALVNVAMRRDAIALAREAMCLSLRRHVLIAVRVSGAMVNSLGCMMREAFGVSQVSMLILARQ